MRVFVFLYCLEHGPEIGDVVVRYVPREHVHWRCAWVHDDYWVHLPGHDVVDDEGAERVVVEALRELDPYPDG